MSDELVSVEIKKFDFSNYRDNTPFSLEDKEKILKEVALLEEDPYAPVNVDRKRCYGNAIIIPWLNNQVIWLPTHKKEGCEISGYDQGGNNPEHRTIRYFNSLNDEVKSTRFLKDLIVNNF